MLCKLFANEKGLQLLMHLKPLSFLAPFTAQSGNWMTLHLFNPVAIL
jgi:hypothetical protein